MSRHFGKMHSGHTPERAKLLVAASLLALVVCSALAIILLSTGSSTASTKPVVVAREEPEIKMVDVLVAVQEIEAGQALEPALFVKESRPQVSVPGRVVRDFEEIKGYFSRSLIPHGQPLYRDFITNVRPSSALTANIPEGFRAVTINVDARSSVEGWARPGARVDVVWAAKVRGQPAVTVIVQNARVLSAERQMDAKVAPGMPVPSTVTLLVSSDEAAKIQLASTQGGLSLNLRGDNDAKSAASGSITVDNLLGSGGETKAEPTGPKVRIRNPDGTYEEMVFDGDKLSRKPAPSH